MELQKFDMSNIMFGEKEQSHTILIVGKRETGKTVLVQDILRHQPEEVMGTVITSIDKDSNLIASIKPKYTIHNEYNTRIVENILARQERIRIYNRKNDDEKDGRLIVVMDNCLYESTIWSQDKTFKNMFMNSRCWKIMPIITMSYLLGMPPVYHENVDFVFILRENFIDNRKRIYECYGSKIFSTFEAFSQVMDTYTEQIEYGCLVFDTRRSTSQLFWYKADI